MTVPDGVATHSPGPVPRRYTRRTRTAAATVVVALAALGASWWFGTVHPGMHLSDSGVTETCVSRLTPGERDYAIGGGITFRPSDDVELLSVELVDPVNVRLVEAWVVPTVAQPGGGELIQGMGRWPLTPDERDALTVDWSGERAFVGAQLDGGVEEMPLLHARVVDPSSDASFEAWRVVYRMNGTRWESTFTHAFRAPAERGVDAC